MRPASTILIATLLVSPLVAEAKPRSAAAKQAKVHTDKAAKAHKAGNFDVALAELQAAYDIDPQPKLLFAIAQVQQKLDQCDEAIPNYEKYLAQEKNKQKQAVVKQAIASCKTKLAAIAPAPSPPPEAPATIEPPPPAPAPVVEATPPPVAVEPPPPPPPSPSVEDSPLPPMRAETPPPGRSPFYTDVLGDVLVVGGIGAGVVSVILYSGAKSDLDSAESATSIDAYESLVDSAHDKRTYAAILAAGGAALIGAGILRFALRDRGETRHVAVTPASGGGFVTFSGGF